MRTRSWHVQILALVLIAAGVGLCWYKSAYLGLPLVPGENTPTWVVQAGVSFVGRKGPVQASLAIPHDPPGFVVLDEDFISGGFGLAIEGGRNRRASWAVRRSPGENTLYYRLSVAKAAAVGANEPSAIPTYPPKPAYQEPYGSAVRALLAAVRQESADVATFTRELLLRLNSPGDENVDLLREDVPNGEAWVDRIVEILHGARIPSRVVYGIRLGDARNDARMEPLIQVHNGERWIYFDPATADRGLPDEFLVWRRGDEALLLSEGTKRPPEVSFAVMRVEREVVEVARQRADRLGSTLVRFSLLSLPVNLQNVYRILLMVPVGAFLIVILRSLIGFKTFGTFMPILIALAFRETRLLWGILLFVLLVGLGLVFRFYLERLRLLLVPRLAAVLTIVVILMAAVSVVSAESGMQRGLSVALFPMVIIAMTIERMSILWEEHGPAESIQQGLGSIFVASIAYLVMTEKSLQHLIFVFPEVLFVVLGLILLLGRYTGYRLSELIRFRAAVEPPPS
jgi:hypothetical protein